MIYFGLQLYETYLTHKIFLFEVFVIYVWLIWIIKWVYANKYNKYSGCVKDKFNVSVLVPVLNEKRDIFIKTMQSIALNSPYEIVVVLDMFNKDNHLLQIAKKYTDKVFICENEPGKRHGIACGMEYTHGDIIVLADSDTIFEKNTIKNMTKPFLNHKVGGVTTKQHILYPNRNIISKFCNWMENVRFAISIPAQSVHGSIGCLPGRAIAFRREIIEKHMDEFLNESFLGIKCHSGDDRFLTSMALRDGWKTVYQSDAVIHTDCPVTWIMFIKQQLRWARSSQRETFKALPWLWKRPFTAFCFITDIITPVFFVGVVLSTIFNHIIGTTYFDIPLMAGIVFGLIGMNISLGFRQYPHLLNNKRDIMYLPLYTLFMTFVMTPIRIWGLLTIRKEKWMTRG